MTTAPTIAQPSQELGFHPDPKRFGLNQGRAMVVLLSEASLSKPARGVS